MKLFGKDKNDNAEELLSEEQLPESKTEDAVEAVEEASNFVMNIEGLDLKQEEEAAQELRGATKTLPDQDQIEEAIEASSEAAEPSAEDAVQEAAQEIAQEAEQGAAQEIAQEAAQEASKKAVETADEKLSSVSYESVAQAVVNAKKEPTGRFDRNAMDDETLLAELYALIGDKNTRKAAAATAAEEPAPVQTRPAPRPAARITPEALQDAPEEFVEVEEDTSGVPGWLKGVFILLISLLLSAMTFYAVASDVIGKIF